MTRAITKYSISSMKSLNNQRSEHNNFYFVFTLKIKTIRNTESGFFKMSTLYHFLQTTICLSKHLNENLKLSQYSNMGLISFVHYYQRRLSASLENNFRSLYHKNVESINI